MKHKKIIISLLVTLAILILIFLQIDIDAFLEQIRNIDYFWLVIAILALVPPIVINAYRWKILISYYKEITLWESLKINLTSYSFAMVTPARVGDFSKAFFLKDEKLTLAKGLSATLFEKVLDLFSLGFFCILGLVLFNSQDMYLLLLIAVCFFVTIFIVSEKNLIMFIRLIPWKKLQQKVISMVHFFESARKDKKKLAQIFVLSLLIWFLHLVQAYLIFYVINTAVNFFIALALLPLGIFAGLVPLTISGLGTRDSAFIILFSPYLEAHVMVAFSLLFMMRYILPAILGLFFMDSSINFNRNKTPD